MMTTTQSTTTPTLMMVGTGSKTGTACGCSRRVGRVAAWLLLQLCFVTSLSAQEVLMPVRHQSVPAVKESPEVLTLPFFDDFSNGLLSKRLWQVGGTFLNEGYAPLPPTIGMATLDAFDAEGNLYPTATGQLFSCDTLASLPIRLDSVFTPYQRALSAEDSIYLSFFYLPGGGYGNMWERVGDSPEGSDSLILEFFDASHDTWDQVWAIGGCDADTLFAHTGRYWQYQDIRISEPKYLNANFRFRFRNYCSLTDLNKTGMVSNADQWNIDYVMLNAGRTRLDTVSRDVAFVLPASSMLTRYRAMPARQFTANEMADRVRLTIANLFSEELATDFHYHIYNEQGTEVYNYDGGYENIPVFWRGMQYQSSPAHANPPVGYTFPVSADNPAKFSVMYHVREGVSGDVHVQNDTTTFIQVFDNYYAYDDGTPENGYGITSTSSRVKIAYRFRLNVEDTLTALQMYFNRTLGEENASIRFAITVWDDADGVPGNIIYQDSERRHPHFEGFNQYVRYILEEPLVCNGTIYVGIEQYSADYINLGFDRNNDASANILYLSGTSWQTSILRGSLMIRPYFGHNATLAVSNTESTTHFRAYATNGTIFVSTDQPQTIQVYDALGRLLLTRHNADSLRLPNLPTGLYLVKAGPHNVKKVLVY